MRRSEGLGRYGRRGGDKAFKPCTPLPSPTYTPTLKGASWIILNSTVPCTLPHTHLHSHTEGCLVDHPEQRRAVLLHQRLHLVWGHEREGAAHPCDEATQQPRVHLLSLDTTHRAGGGTAVMNDRLGKHYCTRFRDYRVLGF